MKAKILIVVVCLVIMAACSKDKFSTKPTLTFESINGSVFYPGQLITIKLRLTDKEGDFLSDSGDYMKPYLYYKRVSYACPDQLTDTSAQIYDLPAFPTNKYLDALIDITYQSAINQTEGYPVLNGCTSGNNGKDDSTYFRIWIKDEAGNTSDTLNTPAFKLIAN